MKILIKALIDTIRLSWIGIFGGKIENEELYILFPILLRSNAEIYFTHCMFFKCLPFQNSFWIIGNHDPIFINSNVEYRRTITLKDVMWK